MSLGADGSFYFESHLDWYQGSYRTAKNGEACRLILDVEDSSALETVGDRYTYVYILSKEDLTLDTYQNPGILNAQSASGRAVFIAINFDDDEDDDDEDDNFSIYASCFIVSGKER